jgi:hypothetical protein
MIQANNKIKKVIVAVTPPLSIENALQSMW